MVCPVGRTNIDIDDELVQIVMVRHRLKSKREAVDYALRHLVGQPMTREDALAMFGSMPDVEVPETVTSPHDLHDAVSAR